MTTTIGWGPILILGCGLPSPLIPLPVWLGEGEASAEGGRRHFIRPSATFSPFDAEKGSEEERGFEMAIGFNAPRLLVETTVGRGRDPAGVAVGFRVGSLLGGLVLGTQLTDLLAEI